jgi:hypothetical protein
MFQAIGWLSHFCRPAGVRTGVRQLGLIPKMGDDNLCDAERARTDAEGRGEHADTQGERWWVPADQSPAITSHGPQLVKLQQRVISYVSSSRHRTNTRSG